MLKTILGAGAVAALAMAAPAMATATPSYSYNFTNLNTATNGTYGNTLSYSVTSGTSTVKVRASAWTLNSNGSISKAWLGAYGGAGLGVTSSSDGTGGGNLHTVDNAGSYDFIALQFDSNVIATSAIFSPYQIGSVLDNDASVFYGSTANPFTTALDLTNSSYTYSLIKDGQSLDNNGYAGAVALNPNKTAGNLMLVMAKLDNTDYLDGFKLKNVTVSAVPTATPAVPEPASWAMMIAGFGLVGGALRRRTAVAALA